MEVTELRRDESAPKMQNVALSPAVSDLFASLFDSKIISDFPENSRSFRERVLCLGWGSHDVSELQYLRTEASFKIEIYDAFKFEEKNGSGNINVNSSVNMNVDFCQAVISSMRFSIGDVRVISGISWLVDDDRALK
jgi:hypothetical protein